MRARILIWWLLAFAVSCTASPEPVLPAPTAMRFPATWTPAPTSTPAPPAPTATLVIQSTPGDSTASSSNTRRYPYFAYNTIGTWVDTTHLSVDAQRLLAPRVQLASGPYVGAVRQLNPRVISLARLDAAEHPETLLPSARMLDPTFDGLLLEQVGSGEATDPFGPSNQLLASVRVILDTHLLIADTYAWSDGAAFEEHSSDVDPLLRNVDGVCLCKFLRAAKAPLSEFESEAEWKKQVNALSALSSHPNLIVLVATRFDQVTEDEFNQLQPWFDYSLASFLIGENGSYTYFSFQGPHADDYMASSELTTLLGYPVGGYFPSFGMYARHFQHGLVVVNAGDSVREMPLPRLYNTPFGEQLTRVRLEPRTGEILLLPQ